MIKRSVFFLSPLIIAAFGLSALHITALAYDDAAVSDDGKAQEGLPDDMQGDLRYLLKQSTKVPEATKRQKRPEISVGVAPDVPDYLNRIQPMTLQIVVSGNGRESVRTISRSNEHVHVSMPDECREWLFTRNPVDRRRVAGFLIDHRKQAILHHNEINLRDRKIANGWVDVLMIGLQLGDLAQVERTGSTVGEHGIVFHQYLRDESQPKSSTLDEVWWSEKTAVPLNIVASNADTSWTQQLISSSFDIDKSLFENPAMRYPEYVNIDLVDWAEESHE